MYIVIILLLLIFIYLYLYDKLKCLDVETFTNQCFPSQGSLSSFNYTCPYELTRADKWLLENHSSPITNGHMDIEMNLNDNTTIYNQQSSQPISIQPIYNELMDDSTNKTPIPNLTPTPTPTPSEPSDVSPEEEDCQIEGHTFFWCFPTWLMYALWIPVVMLIGLIVLCIIFVCLKKRLCCFKNRGKPKPNVAQDVEDLSGVHGSRDSFGAATGSEIEMFDG